MVVRRRPVAGLSVAAWFDVRHVMKFCLMLRIGDDLFCQFQEIVVFKAIGGAIDLLNDWLIAKLHQEDVASARVNVNRVLCARFGRELLWPFYSEHCLDRCRFPFSVHRTQLEFCNIAVFQPEPILDGSAV